MNRHHPIIRAVAILMVFLMLYSSAGVREFIGYCMEFTRSIHLNDRENTKETTSPDICDNCPDIILAYYNI